MPIYQRPTENIGVTKTFSGTITDSGSTPIEGAVVALKRKGGGAILYADTDASGNYSFSIDADGDFQLEYSLSKDSSIRTTTDELSPANPFSYYDDNDSNTGYYACIGVPDFPQSAGSGPTWCAGVPTAEVVDAGPYLLRDAILTYGFTGPGEGAKVSVSLCPSGGYYASYSSRVLFDHDPRGGIGYPLHRYNITSFGRNYQHPALKLTGTVVQYYGGSLQSAIDAGFTNAFEYDNSVFYTYTTSWYYQMAGRQLELGEYQLYDFWGNDHSLWGSYQSDYNGGKFSVALPGEQGKSNFDSASSISAADAELISIIRDDEVYSVNNHQFQIYGQIIYLGVTGVDGNGVFNGYREGSAKEAEASGRITLKELDILKGYFGRYGLIEGILPIGGATTTTIANFFNFGYQMIQGITQGVSGQYSADSSNNWMYEMNGGNKSTLFTAVAKEFRSFLRQKAGTDIPESQFSNVIYPILQKAGITYRYTGSGSQRKKWTFTSTGIVIVSDPE